MTSNVIQRSTGLVTTFLVTSVDSASSSDLMVGDNYHNTTTKMLEREERKQSHLSRTGLISIADQLNSTLEETGSELKSQDILKMSINLLNLNRTTATLHVSYRHQIIREWRKGWAFVSLSKIFHHLQSGNGEHKRLCS